MVGIVGRKRGKSTERRGGLSIRPTVHENGGNEFRKRNSTKIPKLNPSPPPSPLAPARPAIPMAIRCPAGRVAHETYSARLKTVAGHWIAEKHAS